jgi:hypothetical protein
MENKPNLQVLTKKLRIKSKNEIKDEALSLIDQFTMHGLPNVFRAKNTLMRSIWLLAFLASTCTCVWLTINGISDYLKYPVFTRIRIQTQIPFTLPAITICNANSFATEYGVAVSKMMASKIFKKEFKASWPKTRTLLMSSLKSANLTDEQKKRLGYSYGEFFISCLFLEKSCDPNDFVWYFDRNYGNCFVFNSAMFSNGTRAAVKSLQKLGRYNGLELEIFSGNPNNNYSFSIESGVHVFIHNQSLRANSDLGSYFPNGFSSNLALGKIINRRLPYPYSECRKELEVDDEFFEIFKKSSRLYNQAECFDLCIQKEIIEECNCTDPTLPDLFNVQRCQNPSQFNCMFEETDRVVLNLKASCENKCPLECEVVSYTTSITTSHFPSDSYADHLLMNPEIQNKFTNSTDLTKDELRKNVLSLNIYLDSFEYTEITELASQSLLDLIASIGGTFGLFIGISFLSFLEVCDLLSRVIFIWMSNNWFNKQRSVESIT